MTPPPSARFGVISDIDDTVISPSDQPIEMILTIFLLNGAPRAFKGVAGTCRALRQGRAAVSKIRSLCFE
jgi:phosphatidate phosphatase APP1